MHGLKVFINGETLETCGGCPVFYSRREDGPYYRWSYDDTSREWRVDRVLRSGVSPRIFEAATWKKIPEPLQKSMADHYQID